MFAFLKDHPFAVEAFFESSLVLTFAVPKEQLEGLIPKCLQLDTFLDKWVFISVTMVAAVKKTGLRLPPAPNQAKYKQLFEHSSFLSCNK